MLSWRLDADAHATDPRLAAIRKVRGYSYVEVITIARDKLPGYEDKIRSFYEEHIHADEEIRFVLDGTGAFFLGCCCCCCCFGACVGVLLLCVRGGG